MGEAIFQILTPTFIVTCLFGIIVFLSKNWWLERLKNAVKHDYDKQLKAYEAKLKLTTDTELAKVNNRLSMELELTKLKLGPYSERQFTLYNELWISLCHLKQSMELLWVSASEENLTEFAQQLVETSDTLEKSALLVEQSHYDELKEILKTFGDYRLGKKTLIDLRKERIGRNIIHDYEIRELIDGNRQTREHLRHYLPQMMGCLRSQIAGIRTMSNEGGHGFGSPVDGI
jgi:hypothetical protein